MKEYIGAKCEARVRNEANWGKPGAIADWGFEDAGGAGPERVAPNEPNFAVFGLKMEVERKSKANLCGREGRNCGFRIADWGFEDPRGERPECVAPNEANFDRSKPGGTGFLLYSAAIGG